MPVDSHLTWAEVRDFSAGLWTVNDQLMPPSGAQVMTDCYATPSGGLRAWFKPTTFTTSGITSTTAETVVGMFAHENIANRSGGGLSNDFYLLTYDSTDNLHRLYRMDQTNSETTWTKIKTHAAGSSIFACAMTAYNDASGDLYVVYTLGSGGAGADAGIWSVKYSDGTITHQLTKGDFVANYQSRIIAADKSALSFTDPGTFLNFSTNTAPVDINEGQPNILAVATFSPGDLLVFKEGAPIYLVEGDLDNYTVRQMNGSKGMRIGGIPLVRGPQGVIFRCSSDGIYETPDGSTVNPLSKNLSSAIWTHPNPISWWDHWLFCADVGLVYDYDTGCWFDTSAMSAAGFVTALRHSGFWIANNAATFTLGTITPTDGSTDNRAESYTWKGAPLRDPNGRQIEIRAIEIVERSANGATSTVTVTVNGSAQTFACDSSGRGALTYYFRQRRETLDITVTAASNASGVEAPRIEAVRIGSQGGHFLTAVTDAG